MTKATRATTTQRDAGVRLITTYKLVKGTVSLTCAAALCITILAGGEPLVDSWAAGLAHHMTRAWTLELAHLIERAAKPHRLWIAAGALAADGAITLLEGWALHHGKKWGEWLVVIATGSLLPFEILAIVHGLHIWRIAAFVLNLGIVIYLARRATKTHDAPDATDAPRSTDSPATPADTPR